MGTPKKKRAPRSAGINKICSATPHEGNCKSLVGQHEQNLKSIWRFQPSRFVAESASPVTMPTCLIWHESRVSELLEIQRSNVHCVRAIVKCARVLNNSRLLCFCCCCEWSCQGSAIFVYTFKQQELPKTRLALSSKRSCQVPSEHDHLWLCNPGHSDFSFQYCHCLRLCGLQVIGS